jgi:hypothetical protein
MFSCNTKYFYPMQGGTEIKFEEKLTLPYQFPVQLVRSLGLKSLLDLEKVEDNLMIKITLELMREMRRLKN